MPLRQGKRQVDLKQLGYFVRVAELGSFTRAAILLGVAQPALSRQVRLLEVELRQALLVRNGRGVTLTEAGKLLLEHSRGLLRQVERMREELGRVRGARSGRVAVGLPPTLSKVLTVPVTRAFQQLAPDAALSITEGLSVAMQERLRTGSLDLALLYNAGPSPDLDLAALLEEELLLVERRSARGNRTVVSLAEVARTPLVIPSRPNAIRMLVESALSDLGLHPTVALEIDGVGAILDLVADGAGSAILSRHAVGTAANPARYTMRRIAKPGLRSRLYVAVDRRRPTTATQAAMRELLVRVARETLGDA